MPTETQKVMTKPTAAFRNFSKDTKNYYKGLEEEKSLSSNLFPVRISNMLFFLLFIFTFFL